MNFLEDYDIRPPSVKSQDFIAPFSKSYTHRLKLIHEKRQKEEQRILNDPYEARSYGSVLQLAAPNGGKMHHSQRTFGLTSLHKRGRAEQHAVSDEESRGRTRSRSFDRFYKQDDLLSQSRSRSRSNSSVGSRSVSRSRSRSRSTDGRSRFERQLQASRDIEAKQKQQDALLQVKREAYVNFLKAKDGQAAAPWVPSGRGPKHDESRHRSINAEAADKLLQQRAWRRSAWPGLLPEERREYGRMIEGRASKQPAASSAATTASVSSAGRARTVDSGQFVNAFEVPLPVEADPKTRYRTVRPPDEHTAVSSSSAGPGRTAASRELLTVAVEERRLAASDLATVTTLGMASPVARAQQQHGRGLDEDGQSLASHRSASTAGAGRKVVLSHVSAHLALTIRMIAQAADGRLRSSYGILALRRGCSRADLVSAIEKQFDVFGQISDISIAAKQVYSGEVAVCSLSLNTIAAVPEIDDDSDIVVYLGGALYQAGRLDPGDLLFSQPLRDFRAPGQGQGPQQSSGHGQGGQGLLDQEDLLFYDSIANNISAFDDYAARERTFLSRGLGQLTGAGHGPGHFSATHGASSVVTGLTGVGSEASARLRDHDAKRGAFSIPRHSLGAPKAVALDGRLAADFHPSQLTALLESGLLDQPPPPPTLLPPSVPAPFVSSPNPNNPSDQAPLDVDEELRKELGQLGPDDFPASPGLAYVSSRLPTAPKPAPLPAQAQAALPIANPSPSPLPAAPAEEPRPLPAPPVAQPSPSGPEKAVPDSHRPLAEEAEEATHSPGPSHSLLSASLAPALTLSDIHEAEAERGPADSDDDRPPVDKENQRTAPNNAPAAPVEKLSALLQRISEKADRADSEAAPHPLTTATLRGRALSSRSIDSASQLSAASRSRRSKSPGRAVVLPLSQPMRAAEERHLSRMAILRAPSPPRPAPASSAAISAGPPPRRKSFEQPPAPAAAEVDQLRRRHEQIDRLAAKKAAGAEPRGGVRWPDDLGGRGEAEEKQRVTALVSASAALSPIAVVPEADDYPALLSRARPPSSPTSRAQRYQQAGPSSPAAYSGPSSPLFREEKAEAEEAAPLRSPPPPQSPKARPQRRVKEIFLDLKSLLDAM